MPDSPDSMALREGRGDSRIGMLLSERYRIDALVDRGAMGSVYAAEHVLMHKRVAIKVLHRELTMVPEFVARFEREARAAANIDSDHVVAATDFGKLPDGAVFLVLEFIEGKNLRDEMTAGLMPVARVLHIGRQIAVALGAAHALRIVHRDLKPENVMLVEKGGDADFVKVLDFGIAKVPIGEIDLSDGLTRKPITKAGMVFGTPEYMPPEQALGQDVDRTADLYSLGVMLFEMLAGCRPFVARSQVGVLGQQLSTDAPKIAERAPGVVVPPRVERLIQRLLAREASERPPKAEDVAAEIDALLGIDPGRLRIPTLQLGTGTTRPSSLDEDGFPTRKMSTSIPPAPLTRLSHLVDARRRLLPAALRGWPAPVLVSVPLGVAGFLLGFAITRMLSTRHPTVVLAPVTISSAAVSMGSPARAVEPAAVVPPTATKPTAAELGEASSKGSTALTALELKYPNDASVRVALVGARLKEKDPGAAVQALAEALALDPDLDGDARVASALWVLVQNRKSSPRAFELLEGPMGERGQSILNDLVTTRAVRAGVRARAKRALASLNNR